MKVEDIMVRDVISAKESDAVPVVAQLLSENKIHGVPVLDKDNHLVGIITETDFFTKDSSNIYLPSFIDFIKEGSPEDVEGSSDVQAVLQSTAKDIMTPECLTINREKTVHDLIAFIKENNLSTIPVVDDSGDLVGIVTVADIIKLL